MKKLLMTGFFVAISAVALVDAAEEAPPMPGPEKEHEWLQQLVGEWVSEGEMFMQPGEPPLKCEGSESVRSLGGFWTISEGQGTFVGVPVKSILTLGYDPEKKKYVGTWVDSMTSHMWNYEGTLDSSGKILTLETEGPNFFEPGATAKMRDSIEIKSEDHRVMTSTMQGDNGEWVTVMTANYHRKK